MAPRFTMGEPLELAGKRMAFTNYHYIRSGSFRWYDDKGNDITVGGTAGLLDARIRVEDPTFGIRIIAEGAERAQQPLCPLEPVKPWEEDGVEQVRILYDEQDGYYKSWGNCAAGGKRYICYVQSRDFQTWERPELGVVEFDGSKDTNLVEAGGETGELGAVFKDPSSDDERWKWIADRQITREEYDEFRRKRPDAWDPKADRVDVSVATHVGTGNFIMAVKGGVSPDGFRWKTIPEPLVVQHADTTNTAYYDPSLRKYVGYFRHWVMGERSERAEDDRGLSWMSGRRMIGRAETDDFRRFPLSEPLLEPGPDNMGPSDTLYTNCHTLVPFAPDQHLFFPAIFHQMNDSTTIAAVSSSDGKMMHWLPGNPVLDTGNVGAWDGGCVFARPNLLELPDGSWVLPYTGYNVPHKYPRKGAYKGGVGFATWPKGRLVAVEAVERGQFSTYSIMPPGRKIRINGLTRRGGSIRVELADLDRKPIPGRSFADCDPIVGDQHKTLITWNGDADIGVPENTPIGLRFQLDQAKLYFVDFE